jgi:hypothetical protein
LLLSNGQAANNNTAIGVGTLTHLPVQIMQLYIMRVLLLLQELKILFLGSTSAAQNGSESINNATAIGYAASVNSSNTVQLGNTSVTLVNTSGAIKAGAITYPNTDGAANQVLTTNGSG